MKNKNNIKINIILSSDTDIYNQYNQELLSDDLSNYIYNQCRGKSHKKDITLNIYHDFIMKEEDKNKLRDAIRSNYGIDVKENLLKIKYEHIKEYFLFLLGIILLLFSNFFNYINISIIGEIISIFSCVVIWEVAYNLIFIDTQIRLDNKRLKKLTESKIIFIENQKNTNEI